MTREEWGKVAQGVIAALKAPGQLVKEVASVVEAGAEKVRQAPGIDSVVALSEHSGAAPLWSAFRQGVHELGAAFGKALPDSIQVDEPGSHGTAPTPGQVDREKHALYGSKPEPSGIEKSESFIKEAMEEPEID